MAIGAYPWRDSVLSDQGEARIVVIERRIRPINRVVTGFARSRESSRGVCGISGSGVILLVAGIAQRAVQRIVVVHVAIGTGPRRHQVGVGQRETGCRMIELPIGP